MQIGNVSSQQMYVQCRAVPTAVDPGGASAMPISGGRTLTIAGRLDGLPSMVWLYSEATGIGPAARVPFWKGLVPAMGSIDADPGTARVTWNEKTFDEEHLTRARALVGDSSLDGVTLDALRAHAISRDPAGPADLVVKTSAAPAVQQFSDCELGIAGVVLDAVLLVFGVGSLIKTLNTPSVVNQVASTVGTAGLDAQRDGIAALAATQPGGLAMAGKVFGIIQDIGSTALPGIFMAAISNLSLLDKALYVGLTGAQVAAIFASGGTWAIPFIGIQLGLTGIRLGKSISECYLTCNPGQQLPIVLPDAPEGSFIVGKGGSRLVPSSNPDNPRVLLASYPADPAVGLWDIQSIGPNGSVLVSIRSLEYPDLYIFAPQDLSTSNNLVLKTLDPGGIYKNPLAVWWAGWSQSETDPTTDTLSGYTLSPIDPSISGLAMHVANWNFVVLLQPFTPGPQSDTNFLYLDTRKGGGFDLSNEFRIGWRLELFAANNDWSFWNGTEQSSVALPAQEGTLTRPDDVGYWSVVAMAKSNTIHQGIAQVRCWSNASGRYVQAAFIARGSWERYGKQDREVSTASDESYGAIFSAWIIPDEN